MRPRSLAPLESSVRVAEPGTAANDGTSATGGSARSEVSGIDDKRWQPRRGLAVAVSALTFLIPFVAATLAVETVTKFTDRPRTFFPFVVWLLMLLVIATVVLRVVDRQARRMLPLATLLRLSLVFPDQAPSRFSLALTSGTGRALERARALPPDGSPMKEAGRATATGREACRTLSQTSGGMGSPGG